MAATELPLLTVIAEDARRSPERVSLKLNAAELALLAENNGLASVENFAMKATALGMKGRKLRVEGEINASVTYTCGVSLKPYSTVLHIPFEQFYLGEGAKPQANQSIDIDPMEESDVEPLVDGAAHLGDLAYQLFTVALDPYPRHPDLTDAVDAFDEHAEDEGAKSPFAVLKGLKL
ncbi:MAG: DUF177 domain-containing protein [Devosiaceae bacterium]